MESQRFWKVRKPDAFQSSSLHDVAPLFQKVSLFPRWSRGIFSYCVRILMTQPSLQRLPNQIRHCVRLLRMTSHCAKMASQSKQSCVITTLCVNLRGDVVSAKMLAVTKLFRCRVVDPSGKSAGRVLGGYPTADSPLRLEDFFETLYLRYDERYVFSAPDLKSVTRRREWSADSPVFDPDLANSYPVGRPNYQPRIAIDGDEEDS